MSEAVKMFAVVDECDDVHFYVDDAVHLHVDDEWNPVACFKKPGMSDE